MADVTAFDRVRVLLLADTHGYVDPRVAAEVGHCDVAVHAGDIGGAAVLDALAPRLGIVIAVRGNNDRPDTWPEAEQTRLAGLEQVATLELPGGHLVVVHGDQHTPARRRHHLLRQQFPAARVVVYGHSHRLACDCDAMPWVLNPGAAGRARTHGGPSCLILLAADTGWQVEMRQFEQLKHRNKRSRS
jgi:uncharacterized protein